MMSLASRMVVILFLLPSFVEGGADRLSELMDEMEGKVRELGEAIKEVYLDRNCTEALASCKGSNIDWYDTALPDPTCYDNKEYNANCTGTCNGKYFDYTVSNVLLNSAKQQDPPGQWYPQIIDSLCYTRPLDETYFRNQRDYLLGFEENYGIAPPPMYFGSQEGIFRIYPARHTDPSWAAQFDVRIRPWYVAATASSPKNIVLVLDTSDSLGTNLGILQETAKQLIRNLTDSDNIAVIHFNNMSHVIGDINNPLKPANETNKLNLTNEIEGLVTSGYKNLYTALNTSFDILDQSIATNAECQHAIIVLTGGDSKFTGDTFSEDDIINLVTTRLNDTSYKIGGNSSIPFFIYSIGGDDRETDLFYQKLACQQIAGFWSKIENENIIISRLSAYRQLFAYGSFEGPQNVSWSDAYTFAFGGVNGSTVFTPVFDNSTSPPRLLGVAGMNLSVKAMEVVLNSPGYKGPNWIEILQRRIEKKEPTCQKLTFNRSQFETFRSFVSTDSICLTNFTPKAASDCPVEDYGFNLFTSNTTNDVSASLGGCVLTTLVSHQYP